LGQHDFCAAKMSTALAEAVVPEIPEIRDAFETNLLWLRNHLATRT
jgi:hypothetical protein